MWNPLSWVMEVAAIMATAMVNGGVIIFLFHFPLAFKLFFSSNFWCVCVFYCISSRF